jgi:hypothetical protein
MDQNLVLSADSRTTAGILLLAIVTIEYGGIYILSIVRGRRPMTEFQTAFARAGHGHAGVLVILALVCQILVEAADVSGPTELLARNAIPLAAILMPAGFFFSSAGRDATAPNRFVVLIYVGAALLAVGVIALGLGLLAA